MTIYVDTPDARLVKIVKCLCLLSSNRDGEKLAAADAACRLLKENNLSWEQLILDKKTPAVVGGTVEEKIGTILAYLEALSAWEKKFVNDVNGRGVFSERQREVLNRVFKKVVAYRAARANP
jgi:hypothetical protein